MKNKNWLIAVIIILLAAGGIYAARNAGFSEQLTGNILGEPVKNCVAPTQATATQDTNCYPCNPMCQNGGICKNGLVGKYSQVICSCPIGWAGKFCEKQVTPEMSCHPKLCNEKGQCSQNECMNGGSCVTMPAQGEVLTKRSKGSIGYECKCPAGFCGKICEGAIGCPSI
jgi:hypothetical protein